MRYKYLVFSLKDFQYIYSLLPVMPTNGETRLMFYCKACFAFYDGCAQCCFELDHEIFVVNHETNEVIGKHVEYESI